MGLFSVQRSVADNVHLSQQDNSMRVLHCLETLQLLGLGHPILSLVRLMFSFLASPPV